MKGVVKKSIKKVSYYSWKCRGGCMTEGLWVMQKQRTYLLILLNIKKEKGNSFIKKSPDPNLGLIYWHSQMEDHSSQPQSWTTDDLVKMQMPFGKYKGLSFAISRFLSGMVPAEGFPKGKLGMLLLLCMRLRPMDWKKLLDPLKR